MWMTIYVEPPVSGKADEGDAEFSGQVDGQARRCADGDDDGNGCAKCFLEQFEAGAAAEDDDVTVGGKGVGEQAGADELVHGVVTAHVFAQFDELAILVEEAGGVNSSGFVE